MAYLQVTGTFKQRGDDSVKHLPSVSEFAQEHFLTSIIRVGSAGDYLVSVVTYTGIDNNTRQQMVKHGLYDFISFTSEEDLKAYNNMSETVRTTLGAYSSTYKVGEGFED